MVNYFVIAVLVILGIFLLRAKHLKEKVFAALIILLVIFFYTTASAFVKTNKVDLKTFDGVVSVSKLYFNWIVYIAKNVVSLGGNVVKMDWQGNFTNENLSMNLSK